MPGRFAPLPTPPFASHRFSPVLFSLALTCAGFVAPLDAGPAAEPRFRLIAYTTARGDVSRIDATRLTHVNYAFGLLNEQSEVYFRSPEASARHLAALVALKDHNPQLKVLLSIGGWGADHFSDAALTPDSRVRFARSALAVIQRHQVDGVDLDWEYPGHPGPGIKFRAEDKENFTHLLRTFREILDAASTAAARTGDARYLLTIASSDGAYFDRTEMNFVHRYLDWINVMTYDRYGEWSKTTGHHAGLFAPGGAPGAPTTASAVRQHLAAGIPREKIVVGAAFYGRGWTGVKRDHHGLLQPTGVPIPDNLPYARLAREFIGQDGYQRHWDADARAAFLWQPDSGTFITFEDPEALQAKARYVTREELGGVMYWEQTHDPDGVLLDALHRTLGAGTAEARSAR